MGRTAATHTLSRRRRAPGTSSMWAPGEVSTRAGTAGAVGTSAGLARPERSIEHRATRESPLLPSIPEPRHTVYAARSIASCSRARTAGGAGELSASRPGWSLSARQIPPLSTRSQGAVGRRRTGFSGARTAAVAGSRRIAGSLRRISGCSHSTRAHLRRSTRRRGGVSSRALTVAHSWQRGKDACRGKRCPRCGRPARSADGVRRDGRRSDQEPGRRTQLARREHRRWAATAVTAPSGRCPRSSLTGSNRRGCMRRPVAWGSSGAATAVAGGARRTLSGTHNARTRRRTRHGAPQTIYGIYGWRGVFESRDGGVHWRATNTGLSLVTNSWLAVDPNRPQIVYASAGQLGLFKSSDGGANWRPVAVGIIDAVTLDPRDPRIVLAASATPKVVRSTDAGRTWHTAGAGMATRPVALAISGETPTRQRSRAASTSSSDGGRSWRDPATPPKSYAQALAIAPSDPALVYAGFVGSNARGLYKSTDAGRTWQRLTDGLEDADIWAVALDPTHPTTIYIGTGGEGVFKSTDGGAKWRPASWDCVPRDQAEGNHRSRDRSRKPEEALRRNEGKRHLQKHRRRIELASLQRRFRRPEHQVARHRRDRSHALRRQLGGPRFNGRELGNAGRGSREGRCP